jgi:hypothetical protein
LPVIVINKKKNIQTTSPYTKLYITDSEFDKNRPKLVKKGLDDQPLKIDSIINPYDTKDIYNDSLNKKVIVREQKDDNSNNHQQFKLIKKEIRVSDNYERKEIEKEIIKDRVSKLVSARALPSLFGPSHSNEENNELSDDYINNVNNINNIDYSNLNGTPPQLGYKTKTSTDSVGNNIIDTTILKTGLQLIKKDTIKLFDFQPNNNRKSRLQNNISKNIVNRNNNNNNSNTTNNANTNCTNRKVNNFFTDSLPSSNLNSKNDSKSYKFNYDEFNRISSNVSVDSKTTMRNPLIPSNSSTTLVNLGIDADLNQINLRSRIQVNLYYIILYFIF